MTDLHIELRPQMLDEVIGQHVTCDSIANLFATDSVPHAFLFCGASGVGKTTLARIIGSMLKAEVYEFDAATNSSVQDVRSIISGAGFASLAADAKLFIIDECQSLSKQAWQAFLKTIEEPPPHVYFAFCTTENSKVPKTVKTRCHTYNLADITSTLIESYLQDTCSELGFQVSDKAVHMIAREAYGSVRQALVYLSMCEGAKDIREVEDILSRPGESVEVIDLCRALLKRDRIETVVGILKDLDARGLEPESVRIVIMSYMKSTFLNSGGKKKEALFVMSCFSRQCNGPDGMAQLCLNVGELYNG